MFLILLVNLKAEEYNEGLESWGRGAQKYVRWEAVTSLSLPPPFPPWWILDRQLEKPNFWICCILTNSTWKWKFPTTVMKMLISVSLFLFLLLLLLILLLFSLCWKNTHYTGIMLNAPTIALCPKLCRHNASNPSFQTPLVSFSSQISSHSNGNLSSDTSWLHQHTMSASHDDSNQWNFEEHRDDRSCTYIDLTIPVQILHPTQAKIKFLIARHVWQSNVCESFYGGNVEELNWSAHCNTGYPRISVGVTRSTSQLSSNFPFGKLSTSLSRQCLRTHIKTDFHSESNWLRFYRVKIYSVWSNV